jgi:hypothetical protein
VMSRVGIAHPAFLEGGRDPALLISATVRPIRSTRGLDEFCPYT